MAEIETSSSSTRCAKSKKSKYNQKVPKCYSKPIELPDINEKKAKLRTSRDVYNRLKWDASSLDIDISQLYIGYKDRFLGMCEVPFTEFNPCSSEGEIPFHRIYYFRGGGPPICPFIGEDGEVRVREDNWPPSAIIYWDRESRLDLIFNSGEELRKNKKIPNSAKSNNKVNVPKNYNIAPVYAYNQTSQTWEVYTSGDDEPRPECQTLKLLTMNILYELYDQHIVVPYLRWPYLIDFLETSKADIIALQEVTPTFLSILESQPWVQRDWLLTDISSACTTIRPYGQVLLSKIPMSNVYWSETMGKRFVIGEIRFENVQGALHVANVHLKSNHKGDAEKFRTAQFAKLAEVLNNLESDSVIVGDTNFLLKEGGKETMNFIDTWPQLCPNDPGYSFNIDENWLSRTLTTSAQFERFDRIYLKRDNQWLKPVRMSVIGKDLIDLNKPARATHELFQINPEILIQEQRNLNLSDHFAVECEFYVDSSSLPQNESNLNAIESELTEHDQGEDYNSNNFEKLSENRNHIEENDRTFDKYPVTLTTAVCIIPPLDLWPTIQSIRSKFDPAFSRWPPHVNLLYGFIPYTEEKFSEAQIAFREILSSYPQFSVKFTKVSIFQHHDTTTVYLKPENNKHLTNIQQKLQKIYPQCHNNAEYTPHLTIAKLPTKTSEEREVLHGLIEEWQENLFGQSQTNCLEFTVSKVALMSRDSDSPFSIQKSVLLGHHDEFLNNFLKVLNLLPSSSRLEVEKLILQEVQEFCNKAIGEKEVSVHLTGSSLLGLHDDSSDMDILACGPTQLSHESFLRALELCPTPKNKKLQLISTVLDTSVPIARLKYDYIDIDLVFCPCGVNNWALVSNDTLVDESEAWVRSIDGIREARILRAMIPYSYWSTYATAVRSLKYWAKQRKIYSKVTGYLSSNTISLLVAYVITDRNNWTPEELVEEFFNTFAHWDWPTPVHFNTNPRNTKFSFESKVSKLMPIHSPCYPYLNRNRNVTKSTRGIISSEIRHGQEIFSNNSNFANNWSRICKEELFFDGYTKYIQFEVKCESKKDVKTAIGILESKLVNFVVSLEQKFKQVKIRPYPDIVLHDAGGIAFIAWQYKKGEISKSIFKEFEYKYLKWISKFCKSVSDVKMTVTEIDGIELLKAVSRIRETSCKNSSAMMEDVSIQEQDVSAEPDLEMNNKKIKSYPPNMKYLTQGICVLAVLTGLIIGIRRLK